MILSPIMFVYGTVPANYLYMLSVYHPCFLSIEYPRISAVQRSHNVPDYISTTLIPPHGYL
jgi:hypothetical protein